MTQCVLTVSGILWSQARLQQQDGMGLSSTGIRAMIEVKLSIMYHSQQQVLVQYVTGVAMQLQALHCPG